MNCVAITSGNTRCIRKCNNHPTSYCGIHRSAFYKKHSKSKIAILSDLCDTILKFPKVEEKSYSFIPTVGKKPLDKLLKRGNTVNFITKNKDVVIRDSVVLFKDIYKSDLHRFVSFLYDDVN